MKIKYSMKNNYFTSGVKLFFKVKFQILYSVRPSKNIRSFSRQYDSQESHTQEVIGIAPERI
jgi:hypothetical protein